VQKLLVVRLQRSWDDVIEVKHSYFPITDEDPDKLYFDKIGGKIPYLIDGSGEISKAGVGHPSYNEMYVKTENGTYWGFDAKVALAVDKEEEGHVNFWKESLRELAKKELRAKNKELKKAFNILEEMN
jgi:hypothetical protein